jgi:hypothetical protein
MQIGADVLKGVGAGVRWVAHPALPVALPLVRDQTTLNTSWQVTTRTGCCVAGSVFGHVVA